MTSTARLPIVECESCGQRAANADPAHHVIDCIRPDCPGAMTPTGEEKEYGQPWDFDGDDA